MMYSNEDIQPNNWFSLCISCLKEDNFMTNIFSLHNNISYKDLILETFSITILKSDNFPNLLCTSCVQILINAYDFKKQIESVQKLLIKKLSEFKSLNQNEHASSEIPNYINETKELKSTDCSDPQFINKTNQNKQHDINEKCKSSSAKKYKLNKNKEDEHVTISHKLVTEAKRRFQCDLCGKVYTKEFNLKIHMRDHTGEKPFECDQCGRKFKCRMLLKVHINTHSGERPYKCELCGKQYSRSGNLKEHMYVHAGIKRFKCHVCERPFAQYAHLFQHLKLHTGDRPFKCTHENCEKTFITRIHLNRHLKWHAGEKNFQCTVCGKCFICKFELNKHVECHNSSELIYSCSKCDKKYSRKVSLAKHIRKQHKESQISTNAENILIKQM